MATRKAPARSAKPSRGGSPEAVRARRAIFIEHFLTPGATFKNGTQAALAAGLSKSNAAAWASKTLREPKVKQEIATREAEIIRAAQERTQLTVEKVIESLSRAVLFDPRQLVKSDGTLKQPHEWSDAEAMAIEGFEFTTDKRGKITVTDVKACSRTTARDQALKHLGLIKMDTPPAAPTEVHVHLKVTGMAPLKEVFARRIAQHGGKA
jgi:phage terminase small subunit